MLSCGSLWTCHGKIRVRLYGQAVNYSGLLNSNEYRRNTLADNVTAQVIMDEKRNLFLHFNQIPIAQWFKEQFGLEQEQRRGIKR